MFEPANPLLAYVFLCGSLGRLNNALFLMLIDSAHAAHASEREGATQPGRSNFIGPNQ